MNLLALVLGDRTINVNLPLELVNFESPDTKFNLSASNLKDK